MIVVDASVLATALGDDGPDGDRARARLYGERLSAPELVDLEVTSVLRRQVQNGAADLRRAALALADLAALPLRRAPHRPLLARCWELRDNLTVYDACYVALAEALDVTLLTGDGRLGRAPGLRCRVEVLRPVPLPISELPHGCCGQGRALRAGLEEAGHAHGWLADSRELCQSRTQADGNRITESNLGFAGVGSCRSRWHIRQGARCLTYQPGVIGGTASRLVDHRCLRQI